jgi:hypothetical protein
MKTHNLMIAIASAALTLIGLTHSAPAKADASAVAFLQPYVTWASSQANGPGTYELNVKLVSNEPSQVCSYAENGYLPYENVWYISKFSFYHFTGFVGNSTQYFNDRRFAIPPGLFAVNPFNPAATDSLGISLNANTGSVTLTLNSWGHATLSGDLHAANGVLYGFVTPSSGGQPTMIVLSVSKEFIPIIK